VSVRVDVPVTARAPDAATVIGVGRAVAYLEIADRLIDECRIWGRLHTDVTVAARS
jgi:hypothetical protein